MFCFLDKQELETDLGGRHENKITQGVYQQIVSKTITKGPIKSEKHGSNMVWPYVKCTRQKYQ